MPSSKNVKSIKKKLLLAKISEIISQNNEVALKYDLGVFFQKLCDKV